MKKKKYHTVGTVPKSNRTIVEKGKTDTPDAQVHFVYDRSHSVLCRHFNEKWRVNLVLCSQTSPLSEDNLFNESLYILHVHEMIYNFFI
jgi:hypothetical protein